MISAIKHTVFFLLAVSITYGQNIDSLENELNLAKEDTLKVSILIDLAYASDSLDDQISYARQAYSIGENLNSIRHKSRSELVYGLFYAGLDLDSGMSLMGKGARRYVKNEFFDYAVNAYYIIGINYEIANAFDSAMAAYATSHRIASENGISQEKGDAAFALANINNLRGQNVSALKWALQAKKAYEESEQPALISEALNQIGIIYDQKGLYAEALDNYLQARDIAIAINDINAEILINNNIGVIYDNMNNSNMALDYYSDALEKAKIHDLPDNEATLLNNLSYIHLKRGDTTKAVNLLKQSLSIDLSEIYPCFESYPLEGLGAVFVSQNKLDSAEIILKKAMDVAKECQDAAVMTSVYKDLGMLYAKQNKSSMAKKTLINSLIISEKSGFIAEKKEILNELFKFHERQGENNLAMKYLKEYTLLSDSITQVNSVEKAAELAAQYEFRKQVAEIEKDRRDSELQLTSEIEAKSKENKLILLALATFVLLGLVLLRFYMLIKRQNHKLRWLNEEKNKLMGVVAHDLRNPLNMIIGLTTLFQSLPTKDEDSDLKQYVEMLSASSERMRTMIDRTLDISEIENMKLNLKMEKIDLSKLTFKSIHNFDMIAAKKDIKIVDSIDKSVQMNAKVDSNYLMQAIDNLLSNAIKFSEVGKEIMVSLKNDEDKYVISVKDQGPGISDDDKKNLFKAYTRLSSKPTAQERSTGLGLSIVKKFVDSMGGEIRCESTLGEGTTFELLFEKA